MKKKTNPIITHEKICEITRPAFLFGLFGGVITLALSLFLTIRLIISGNLQLSLQMPASETFVIFQVMIAVLMLISIYLLRKEHHCFGGSVMLLCASIIGLTFGSGLLVGPILGIIGGILGMSEHEKLIKHHLD